VKAGRISRLGGICRLLSFQREPLDVLTKEQAHADGCADCPQPAAAFPCPDGFRGDLQELGDLSCEEEFV
jgi:hypothetical protein